MFTKTSITLLLGMALGSAAQAQSTACPCSAGATLLSNGTAVQLLLSNKMVCANVGSERWQEWHNGGGSGPVVDYKMGPGHPSDPAETVGSYSIAADGTITYTYGSSSYRYAVCEVSNGSYAFCGGNFGGRDITGALVSSTGGLASCDNVRASLPASRTRKVR